MQLRPTARDSILRIRTFTSLWSATVLERRGEDGPSSKFLTVVILFRNAAEEASEKGEIGFNSSGKDGGGVKRAACCPDDLVVARFGGGEEGEADDGDP